MPRLLFILVAIGALSAPGPAFAVDSPAPATPPRTDVYFHWSSDFLLDDLIKHGIPEAGKPGESRIDQGFFDYLFKQQMKYGIPAKGLGFYFSTNPHDSAEFGKEILLIELRSRDGIWPLPRGEENTLIEAGTTAGRQWSSFQRSLNPEEEKHLSLTIRRPGPGDAKYVVEKNWAKYPLSMLKNFAEVAKLLREKEWKSKNSPSHLFLQSLITEEALPALQKVNSAAFPPRFWDSGYIANAANQLASELDQMGIDSQPMRETVLRWFFEPGPEKISETDLDFISRNFSLLSEDRQKEALRKILAGLPANGYERIIPKYHALLSQLPFNEEQKQQIRKTMIAYLKEPYFSFSDTSTILPILREWGGEELTAVAVREQMLRFRAQGTNHDGTYAFFQRFLPGVRAQAPALYQEVLEQSFEILGLNKLTKPQQAEKIFSLAYGGDETARAFFQKRFQAADLTENFVLQLSRGSGSGRPLAENKKLKASILLFLDDYPEISDRLPKEIRALLGLGKSGGKNEEKTLASLIRDAFGKEKKKARRELEEFLGNLAPEKRQALLARAGERLAEKEGKKKAARWMEEARAIATTAIGCPQAYSQIASP